jgi:hypothetical protein
MLDFNLRAGRDAPLVAGRVARTADRYLSAGATRDITASVTEIVAWLDNGEVLPCTMRLEMSVTSSVVRVAVTAAHRVRRDVDNLSHESLRQVLPVTAALAARYGIEAKRRIRVWVEFDRLRSSGMSYTAAEYS